MSSAIAPVSSSAKTPRPGAKRPTNLSLNAQVLDAAKALGINVSQACDRYLAELVRTEQMKRWQTEHADFMVAYNATVQDVDLPLDAWRTF
jgi:antitoxin CcdA